VVSLDTLLADTSRALQDLSSAVTNLKAGLVTVALVNGATNFALSPSVIEALEIQVNRDFAPFWNVHVKLTTATNPGTVPPGAWYLLIADTDTQAGALGWHDQTLGRPYGEVFVVPAQQSGVDLSTVLSHELLEMLADPYVSSMVQFTDAQGSQNLSPVECCDAVENDQYDITTSNGIKVAVSNFVTPAYFDQKSKLKYDFMEKLTNPIPSMTPGGYLSYLPITAGQWTQLGGRLAGTH